MAVRSSAPGRVSVASLKSLFVSAARTAACQALESPPATRTAVSRNARRTRQLVKQPAQHPADRGVRHELRAFRRRIRDPRVVTSAGRGVERGFGAARTDTGHRKRRAAVLVMETFAEVADERLRRGVQRHVRHRLVRAGRRDVHHVRGFGACLARTTKHRASATSEAILSWMSSASRPQSTWSNRRK